MRCAVFFHTKAGSPSQRSPSDPNAKYLARPRRDRDWLGHERGSSSYFATASSDEHAGTTANPSHSYAMVAFSVPCAFGLASERCTRC